MTSICHQHKPDCIEFTRPRISITGVISNALELCTLDLCISYCSSSCGKSRKGVKMHYTKCTGANVGHAHMNICGDLLETRGFMFDSINQDGVGCGVHVG
jgi:hypothetical protein